MKDNSQFFVVIEPIWLYKLVYKKLNDITAEFFKVLLWYQSSSDATKYWKNVFCCSKYN